MYMSVFDLEAATFVCQNLGHTTCKKRAAASEGNPPSPFGHAQPPNALGSDPITHTACCMAHGSKRQGSMNGSGCLGEQQSDDHTMLG